MRFSLLFIAASLLMVFLIENSVDARSNETSFINAKWWMRTSASKGNDGPGKPVKKLAANKVVVKENREKAIVEAFKESPKVFVGYVVSPQGALPGAVVEVIGTQLSAVTDANGAFSLTLTTNSAPVKLLVSYAGFADETKTVSPADQSTTVELTTVQEIKVARRQQMKAYSKTAQRQVKRTLRQL
ncbi:carboxypeptidase-like regulatory domain-containing protein [Hymenobacter arizonensis]|uniref:Carboxypeptidase regulatory-like domain-containing protein n=1 Tax=Hymenobacter arizonensis TaxID=1227077 RepID=A0A1I5ZM91_HYMAR|nr:carboxypeptidase-like regulatory domain-containing protein [Hymenobacter arizonensis]SFQ57562.1 Carboxypeptidase regulatory-like domain-containing protein [Hymenobacter arizonensis]